MTELDKDEQFYRDTQSIAFPKLDDRQLAMLEPLGAANLVFKAGQRDLGLMAVLRGELEVFESRDGQEQIPRDFGPARFRRGRCDAHGHRGAGQRARQSR